MSTRKALTHYAVFHNIGGQTEIVVYYHDGSSDLIDGLGCQEAAYVVDLLRNEKVMSYDASRKRLSTLNPEPTSESDRARMREMPTGAML